MLTWPKEVIEKIGHSQQHAGKMIVTISPETEKEDSATCYVAWLVSRNQIGY